MKVKIIKRYKVREGRYWEPDLIVGCTNDYGKQLITEGFAREIRIEKRKDDHGNEFEVEIEIVDKQGTTITTRVKDDKNKK
jgi:hypothetical protein